MNKEIILKETKNLIAAKSACKEIVDEANVYLNKIGTADENNEFIKFIQLLKECIITVDQLLSFLNSDDGKKVFGDKQQEFLTHAEELKKNGAKYCDCPACKAAYNILKEANEL